MEFFLQVLPLRLLTKTSKNPNHQMLCSSAPLKFVEDKRNFARNSYLHMVEHALLQDAKLWSYLKLLTFNHMLKSRITA